MAVDDLVDWFRSERVFRDVVGNGGSIVISEEENVSEGDEMSEEKMKAILADLNGPRAV